jgi:hypothetical protein
MSIHEIGHPRQSSVYGYCLRLNLMRLLTHQYIHQNRLDQPLLNIKDFKLQIYNSWNTSNLDGNLDIKLPDEGPSLETLDFSLYIFKYSYHYKESFGWQIWFDKFWEVENVSSAFLHQILVE